MILNCYELNFDVGIQKKKVVKENTFVKNATKLKYTTKTFDIFLLKTKKYIFTHKCKNINVGITILLISA